MIDYFNINQIHCLPEDCFEHISDDYIQPLSRSPFAQQSREFIDDHGLSNKMKIGRCIKKGERIGIWI